MAGKKPKKLSDLIPDDRNFNKGSEFGSSLMSKSLSKFGAGRSILIDKNNRIIAGNKTVETAGSIGLDDVEIIETDGKRIIAVKRMDIDLDSPEGRELALADNATAKANIVFDAEVITAEVGEAVAEEWGIDLPENEVTEDGFEGEPPLKPITVLGDVYEINQHRFSCGSSTEADVVAKTLDGAKPILMVTDPPYGVNYDATWRNSQEGKGFKAKVKGTGKVTNDDNARWKDAYALFGGEVAYVWCASLRSAEVHVDLSEVDLIPYYQIIWNKQSATFGRGDYHWKHEPCWYAVRKGKKHNWQGSRTETTVWDIQSQNPAGRGKTSEEDKQGVHSTQKPIECMARPIRNNTFERESVYDPFLGSGTTLIAADQLNRACYGQEIDPAYCDVIVARYIKYKRSQSGAMLSVKRNGKELSEKELDNYLKQIEK